MKIRLTTKRLEEERYLYFEASPTSPPCLRIGDLRTIARLSFSCSQYPDDKKGIFEAFGIRPELLLANDVDAVKHTITIK